MLIFLKGIIWFLQDDFLKVQRLKVTKLQRFKKSRRLGTCCRQGFQSLKILGITTKNKRRILKMNSAFLRIIKLLLLMHCVGCTNFVLSFFNKKDDWDTA